MTEYGDVFELLHVISQDGYLFPAGHSSLLASYGSNVFAAFGTKTGCTQVVCNARGRPFLSVSPIGFRLTGLDAAQGPEWGALDDVVMGGRSESTFQVRPNQGEDGRPAGVFSGFVTEGELRTLQLYFVLPDVSLQRSTLFVSCQYGGLMVIPAEGVGWVRWVVAMVPELWLFALETMNICIYMKDTKHYTTIKLIVYEFVFILPNSINTR